MALNPFFQQGTTAEQNLVQSLINEQLKIYGVEVYYIPRIFLNTNSIIREVIQSEFTNAYPLEAYIQNFEGFEGSGDLMSKFGVRVTDELNLVISQERYETYIKPILDGGVPSDSGGALMPNAIGTPSVDYELVSRPKEGDLIWFPLSDTIFEVKYVEHEQPFYQLKKNYVYELRCEIFEYDNEVIDTGVADIDDNAADDGYILTMNLAGIGSTATGTVNTNTGSVNQLFLTNPGSAYTTAPLVTITEPPTGGTRATAIAIMTSTSSGTQYVDDLRLINPGSGYLEPPIVRFVSSVGVGAAATAGITTLRSMGAVTITNAGSEYLTIPTVTFSSPTTGSGVTATGIAKVSSGSVVQIQITNAGSGYAETFAAETYTVVVNSPFNISHSHYVMEGTDRNGAVSGNDPTITLREGDTIVFDMSTNNLNVGDPLNIKTTPGTGTGNRVTNPAATNNGSDTLDITWTPSTAGTYYYQNANRVNMVGEIVVLPNTNPTVTIGDPSGIATGTYKFNEIVTGSESLSSARVKDWDAPNKVLKVGMVTGDFKIGEKIVGAAGTFNLESTGSSVSSQALDFDTSASYDANVSIEQEGINIIDFTENTPFGLF